MTDRYYIPDEQVQKIREILDEAKEREPQLVAELNCLIFGTPIPSDQADELEP